MDRNYRSPDASRILTEATGLVARCAEGLRGAPSEPEQRRVSQGEHGAGSEAGDSRSVKRISVTEGTWSGTGSTDPCESH